MVEVCPIPDLEAAANFIWLNARLYEMKRLLKRSGSIYVHCDWHASHYIKCELDKIFGYDNFRNDVIWEYAKQHGFAVVTLDADYYDLSLLRGHPPKLIWLRCGNQRTVSIERLLRSHLDRIRAFEADTTAGCLEIY